jgi:hypothetical protein
MSDFVIEKDEDTKNPKIEIPSNLDSIFFVVGSGNIIGKNVIHEFFNCTGTLVCNDTPILKRTNSYGEAISALILKLERRFIQTHPTLQRLFYELPVINNPKAKKIAALILINEFDCIVQEAREIFDFYNMSQENPVIDEILYNEEYML